MVRIPRLPRRQPNKLVYGVTAGVSAWALFKGQLADMAERGWDVAVVATDDERFRAAGAREGVRLLPITMEREIAPVADLKALAAWVVLLMKERPAVLNVGTPKAALLGGMAGWLTRVPRRVYVVRGLRFEGAQGRKRSVLLAMERLTMACATDVVVVSRSVGQEMLAAGLTSKPLLLVGDGSSNGVDGVGIGRRAAEIDVQAVRREFDVPVDHLLVAFVGRLTLDKGAAMMTRALHELCRRGVRVTLLAIGDAESEQAEELLRDPEISVALTGWTDDPVQYLAACEVLVLPTRREGYPNVVLEANACGVPVVTTRATGAIDSVVDGETGLLVDVDDEHGLVQSIMELAFDEELRGTMSEAARRRATTRFRPQRIWNGLACVYEGHLGSDISQIEYRGAAC